MEGSVIWNGRVRWLPREGVCPPSLGTPSRLRERPVMETWMASLVSETMAWWTRVTSMMSTATLRT